MKHGTPDEFSAAVWKASGVLGLTPMESMRAIKAYNDDWRKAGLMDNQGEMTKRESK
jgi:hypothetical protein